MPAPKGVPAHAVAKPAAQKKKISSEKDDSSDEEEEAQLGVENSTSKIAREKLYPVTCMCC